MKTSLSAADQERVNAADAHEHSWEPWGFVLDTDGGLVPTDWCRFCWQTFGVWKDAPMNGHPVKVMPR